MIQYTSGNTRFPKSALHHRGLVNNGPTRPTARACRKAALALELFETYRGAALMAVPTMLVAMTEHPNFATTVSRT